MTSPDPEGAVTPQNPTETPPEPLSLKQVTELLVKHYGLHDGCWDINLEVQVALGSFGPSRERALPGGALTISRIGLTRVPADVKGPNTINAAEVDKV
jgi:hypothetical protein